LVTNATKLDTTPKAADATDGEALLLLEEFLPYQLSVLADTMSQSLSRLYSERHGLGIPEWRVIANLGQRGTMTATEIGGHAQMHKTKVSRAVSGLVDRGYVIRERNRADQREALLQLTPEGRAVYADLVPSAKAFNTALESMLNETERTVLRTALERLTSRSRDLVRAIEEDRL